MKPRIGTIALFVTLGVLLLMTALDVTPDIIEYGRGIGVRQIGLISFYFISFVGASCLCAYVLTPRLLMRGRRKAFYAAIAAEVILVSIVGMVILAACFPDDSGEQMPNPWIGAINLLSSMLLVSLILMAASSYVIISKSVEQENRVFELKRLGQETELAALQRQVSPHFIFNMLNNAVTLVKISPEEGAVLIAKLRSLLKYQIEECQTELMPIESEVRHMREFLELESVRRDKIRVNIHIDIHASGIMLPALLFLPILENAVKHNLPDHGVPYIDLSVNVDARGHLHFLCENSCGSRSGASGGLGLNLLRRRLALFYGDRHTTDIRHLPDKYIVDIKISPI